jgi:hypothetical protein
MYSDGASVTVGAATNINLVAAGGNIDLTATAGALALTSGGTSDISITSAGDIDFDVTGEMTLSQGVKMAFDGVTDANEYIYSPDGSDMELGAGGNIDVITGTGDINLVPGGSAVTVPANVKLSLDGILCYLCILCLIYLVHCSVCLHFV